MGIGNYVVAGAVVIALMGSAPVMAQMGDPGAMPPQQVGVITMQRGPVAQNFSLPGRAVAFEQVLIRPRVGGVVTEILYTPGQPVEIGDPLFRLDDASYVATAANDRATLAMAEADLPVKRAALDRATRLVNQGTTQAALEAAQSEFAAAQATLDSARAALDYSQTQLGWTTIASPISGYTEVADVSVGDLVAAGQTEAMTTVTRTDPIYVDMLETSARLLQLRNNIDNGVLTLNQTIQATLTLEDGTLYQGQGRLVAPSGLVSTSTGTLSVRFEFENKDRKILPGMFVRGTVSMGTVQAWLVPQRAAQRASNGDLTAFVVRDGKTAQVTLQSTGISDNAWVVVGGLTDGDQLVVDGLQALRDGQDVTPVAVQIDEAGLVQDAPKEQ